MAAAADAKAAAAAVMAAQSDANAARFRVIEAENDMEGWQVGACRPHPLQLSLVHGRTRCIDTWTSLSICPAGMSSRLRLYPPTSTIVDY